MRSADEQHNGHSDNRDPDDWATLSGRVDPLGSSAWLGPDQPGSWPGDEVRDESEAGLIAWLEDTLGGEGHGAPRVFDLFTLLAVTVAFAGLFAALKLLQPALDFSLTNVTLGVSSFVTGIAIAQMVMLFGAKPRIASVIAGPLVWQVTWYLLCLPQVLARQSFAPLFAGYFTAWLALPFGYLAGALVAGVFLLADLLRQRIMPARPAESLSPIDPWTADEDDEPAPAAE